MRILGIDPGTGILGFGVIDVTKRQMALVDAGVIKTNSKDSDAIRLKTIYDDLKTIIDENQPDQLSIEKLFFSQNVTTGMTVSQARGVVLLLAAQYNLTVFEYTPLQIKLTITGYGRAEKKQIQMMVKKFLKLNYTPKPDDCADALAAAITHIITNR